MENKEKSLPSTSINWDRDCMLKLKNVSKFYYNKGVIASGFNKVNISFDIGEFVVITGESGSGKSTLLNVISGLDSYEDGEMYINGLETSHYGESDFEEYRKKYVSNIFQNFNLVNSYTVYQNIELVLLINGYKKRDVKDKVLDLIKQVKLTKYKNTKVSKLSGGQKQRVAIARALARETPIIVCDEPTANLDSKSSSEIINILKEISLNKLVIMVTHDYPSVEKIATRVVRMHDGKIISDKKIVDNKIDNNIELDNSSKKIGLVNIIRLGIRNTFNIKQKFILLFIVFLFITVSIMTEYGALRKSEYETSKMGYNWYFQDITDTRIIINKKDGSFISKSDFSKLEKVSNVEKVVENDITLDQYIWFEGMVDDEYFHLDGMFRDIDELETELDYGRMPKDDNEVVIYVDKMNYYFSDRLEDSIKATYYLNGDKNDISVKVVGVVYQENIVFNYENNIVYGTSGLINKYISKINMGYSEINVTINNQNYLSVQYPGESFYLVASDRVKSGKAIVSDNISYTCKDFNCKNKNMIVNIDNLYYKDSLSLVISDVYTDKNVNKLLGINKDDSNYGSIFINRDDYNKLFNRDSYQASVFANRVDNVDSLANSLEDMGYNTFIMKNSLSNEGDMAVRVLKIVKLVVTIVLVITLFFISYFVIKLILKSRNIYFSTLRILGATEVQTKRILDIELFVNSSLAYLSFIGLMMLVKNGILEIKFLMDIVDYLGLFDYVLMYVILVVMSYLISSRFSSKLFKKSAMKSYREEV